MQVHGYSYICATHKALNAQR